MVELEDLAVTQALPHVGVGTDQQLTGRVVQRLVERRRPDRPARIRRPEVDRRVAGAEAALQDRAADVGGRHRGQHPGDPEPVGHAGGGAVADALPHRGQARDHRHRAPCRLSQRHQPVGHLLEQRVTGVARLREGRRQQRVDLVDRQHRRAHQRHQTRDLPHAFLRQRRRGAQTPAQPLVTTGLRAGLQVRLADVLGGQVGRCEQHQRPQRLMAVPHRVLADLGQRVDEPVQHLGFEVGVTDDGAAVGSRHVRQRRQLPQQVLELGFAVCAGPAEALQDAVAHRLPETGRVEQLDDEEEPAVGLHAFANLAEQVGLARTGGAADHHAERRGRFLAQRVGEGVHDVVDGVLVQPADVGGRLGLPQVVDGGRPRQAQRGEGVALQ